MTYNQVMSNKKCAIILTRDIVDINIEKYQLLIGSEQGSEFVLEQESNIDTFHVGDFDSVTSEFKDKIAAKNNSLILDSYNKAWSDGEEAIIYAIEQGFEGKNIDIYVNADGRYDHFAIMLSVLRKYGATMIGKGVYISVSEPNNEVIINKHHKYVSAIFNEETQIKTNGLEWDVDKVFDQDSGTNFVSNEIKGDSFKVLSNKKVLFIQSED